MAASERIATPPPGRGPTVIVKGVDAGHCYLTWRWLDRLEEPGFHVLERETVSAIAGRLDAATPRAALTRPSSDKFDSLLLDAEQERTFFADDCAALLPEPLLHRIRDEKARLPAGEYPTIRFHPPPSLARLPWDLLVVDGEQERLLDLADLRLEVPVTARADRDRRRRAPGSDGSRWSDENPGPVVYVLDPRAGLGQVLPPVRSAAGVLVERIATMHQRGRLPTGVTRLSDVLHRWIGRDKLSDMLTAVPSPSRLFYVGHVSSADHATDRPESAAMHLADDANVPGYAAPITTRNRGRHLPLTALDLLADAPDPSTGAGAQLPSGPQRWPMPPRVALLGCDSGSDHRFAETFGLVIAMIINGAELVTATRWVLPTDHFFHDVLRVPPAITPTASMIAAVDEAHESADPVGTLQAWQRTRLECWRASGDVADSPVVWAALATHHAPALVADAPADSRP